MKALIQRDKKRRKLVNDYFFKRKSLKSIIKDRSLPLETRLEAQEELNELPRDSSVTRLRNRCVLTGRPKGIRTSYGISRIQFRKVAYKGHIFGVKKASW